LVDMLKNKFNAMMEGWVDNIMEFRFTTEYLKGKSNEFADSLSRQNEGIIHGRIVAKKGKVRMTTQTTDVAMKLEAERRGKVIPTDDAKAGLIRGVHLAGHNGVEAMFRKLWADNWWWPKMRSDLKQEVNECVPCQRYTVIREGYHPSMSIEAENPWDHIQVDDVKVPISLTGYCNIKVFQDVQTDYVVIRPLKSKEMEESAQVTHGVFSEYGWPKIMQSDNGTEFVNELVSKMMELYGVDHRLTTPYHPAANGKVERKNKEVETVLRKKLNGNFSSWEEWLPEVQFELNNRISKMTGSTPFALMFARTANRFQDFSDTQVISDHENWLQALTRRHAQFEKTIRPAINERSTYLKKKAREALDKARIVVKSVAPGTKVYVRDALRKTKWEPAYEGPFTVVRQVKGGAYVLKDMTGDEIDRRFTIDMIRPVSIGRLTPGGVEETEESIGISEFMDEEVILNRNVLAEEARESPKSYEVEEILDHEKDGKTCKYFVKWKGYDEENNSWVQENEFDDEPIISRYWKQITKEQKEAKKVETKAAQKRKKAETKAALKRAKKLAEVDEKSKQDKREDSEKPIEKKPQVKAPPAQVKMTVSAAVKKSGLPPRRSARKAVI
jgi:transposase InsO family protein